MNGDFLSQYRLFPTTHLNFKRPTCKWPRIYSSRQYSIIPKVLVSLEMLGWLSSTMFSAIVHTENWTTNWPKVQCTVSTAELTTGNGKQIMQQARTSSSRLRKFYSSSATNFPFIIRKEITPSHWVTTLNRVSIDWCDGRDSICAFLFSFEKYLHFSCK